MISRPLVVCGALWCAAVLLPAAVPANSVEYYSSNAMGVARDPIDLAARGDHEWVVAVETATGDVASAGATTGRETHLLYRDGEEVERRVHHRDDGRLVLVETWSPEGLLLANERYSYWADGSIRAVERDDRDGSVAYRYRGGMMVSEWGAYGALLEEGRYDSLGRLEARVVREARVVIESEERDYWTTASDSPLRTIRRTRGGEVEVEQYDEGGSFIGSARSADDVVRSNTTRRFEDGLLVEERTETPEGVTVRLYEYDGARLASELLYQDQALVVRVDHVAPREDDEGERAGESPDHTRTETIYRSGEPLLRVYYRGEMRIRESVLRDGEAIRTREFTGREVP